MKTQTVNISFRKDLLEQIDRLAAKESRSRSELIREAARLYIERKERWKDIFSFAETWAQSKNIQSEDIEKAIEEYRISNRTQD